MSDEEQIVGLHVPGDPVPESRFFDPTERCPHPGRWTATDGDSTEVEVSEFLGALVRVLQPDLVVETGAAFGGTTEQFALAIGRNGRGRLVSLEIDPVRQAYAVRRVNSARPRSEWSVLPYDALEWTPRPDERIGLLFTDTTRDARVDEILHFRPWLGKGSIVAVHDSAWDMGPLRGWIENSLVAPGIVRAIDLPTPRGLTLCEVL